MSPAKIPNNGYNAVSTAWIFDFDGVLVNTMETHFACYSQALAEVGVPVDKAQFYSQAGMTGREQISWFARKAGIAVDPDSVYRRKGEIFRGLKAEAKKIDCMVELLHLLQASRHLIAIATGSSRSSVQPVMDQFDLVPHALVTSEDVKRGKPHPDLFLAAATSLGVPPGQCIVVEDSDVGIESAKRAGMRALRFFDLA
jgi:HAD superfamily hydrolase (TIGR01509 family)